MRSDTIAVRDRIHAVLRETDGYLSTNQIAEKAGGTYMSFPHYVGNHTEGRVIYCDGQRCMVVVHMSAGNRCYRELVAMEKAGLVFRAVVEGARSLYWAYVEDVTLEPDHAQMLEEIWATPARDHA